VLPLQTACTSSTRPHSATHANRVEVYGTWRRGSEGPVLAEDLGVVQAGTSSMHSISGYSASLTGSAMKRISSLTTCSLGLGSPCCNWV
jgi:hypothetical protein